MTPRLRRRDAIGLLGTVATAALAVSLGLDPRLAVELGTAVAALQVITVLLGADPARPPATVGAHGPPDAATAARRSIEFALAGPWGARGRFRRDVRDAVAARLALHGHELDADGLATLPPELAALLDPDQRRAERGLTPAELDRVLTATEELEP